MLFAIYVCDRITLRGDLSIEIMTHVQIFRVLEKGRMGDDGRFDDIVECKIEHKAG